MAGDGPGRVLDRGDVRGVGGRYCARATALIARTVFDGATNGMRFRAYVTDTLAQVLRPGDTVILDNLKAHKVAGVCEAIEAVGGRVLYLPPYSPDLNPIDPSIGSG